MFPWSYGRRYAPLHNPTTFKIPTLSKSPENIIIHIGTNHIKKKPASEVCNGIKSLTRKATELCRESHISISSLIKRRDDRAGMISKVNSMNKQILQRI